jgi:hypothetical protein
MTICVTVRVAEGLVLAADSATVLTGVVAGPNGPVQTIIQNFNFANKVTHFKDYPIGVLSWGLGSIEAHTIQSLIMQFEHDYPSLKESAEPDAEGNPRPPYTVKRVADALVAFIKDRYDKAYPADGAGEGKPAKQPSLGLYIGGYSTKQFFSDQYVYTFPDSAECQQVRPNKPDGTPNFGANWYGLTDALVRLYLGYDEAALNKMVEMGADLEIVQNWANSHVAALPLVFDGMLLQDAIDFAEYSVQVVIGRFRFAQGPALCGGDIDIAVVTPNTFRWYKRKTWGIHHE